MQINLNNPYIFKAIKYVLFALVFHFILSWFDGCSSKPNSVVKQKVKTPEISGKFEPKKPESLPIEIKQTPISETKKDGLVYKENPLNKRLVEENEKLKMDFVKMDDPLKSISYNKAIELNKFSTNFEDENLKLTIEGIVRGSVEEITPSYIIKEREQEVEVKLKETKLRVLAGGSVGVNREFNQVVFKAGLDFQNKKGNILSAEYLQVNNQGFAMVGFKKSILNIKR